MMNYALITPVLNEERNVKALLDSVLAQTFLPLKWIFVDDGCTDGTVPLIESYQSENPFIEVVKHHKDKGYSSGSKIAKAVIFGVAQLENVPCEVICKIDADLIFPTHYFENVMNEFKHDPEMGLCGGVCSLTEDLSQVETVADLDHVRGALKAYRRSGYTQMGGIRPVEGWDSLDELLLMYHGWKIKVLPELIVYHQRKTDTNTGVIKAAVKSGRSFYILGYNLFVSMVASMKLMMKSPPLILGFLALYGYIRQMMLGRGTLLTKDQMKFINKYRLSKMKKRVLKQN